MFNIDLGRIETGMVNRRDVAGEATVDLQAEGANVVARFSLRGDSVSQSVALTGAARNGNCTLAEPSGLSRFDGQCGPQGLRGVLKVENRSGWRVEVLITAALRSRQSGADLALAAAAERQREDEERQESAEQLQRYVDKLTVRAKSGDVEAMGALGDVFGGESAGIADLSKSFYWYSMAAQRNDPRSMFNVAMAYFQGEGVDRNTTLAIPWLMKCAKLVSKYKALCVKNIGIAYANGDGVEQSNTTAITWFRQCARLGDAKCDEFANRLSRRDRND